jgi:hypothetical protein
VVSLNGDHLQRMTDSWIKEDTERDYSQTEYGKNALVVCESDRGDGEHPDSSGDDSRCARDDGVVCGFRRIVVQSETTVRKHISGKNALVVRESRHR